MGKTAKRTKKFQKNSLSGVIKKRKEDQIKRKTHERREATREKRSKDRAIRREQLAAKRAAEESELNDVENFSDEDVNDLTLEQDVEDYLEKLTNEQLDSDDEDDLSEESFDSDDVKNLVKEIDEDQTNKKLRSQVEEHKAELDKLKEADPAFYEFLKENDQELLDFDEEMEEESDDESGDEDDDEEIRKPKKKSKGTPSSAIVLSMEMIDALIKDVVDTKSTKAMKKLVVAYKSGCSFTEGEESDEQLPYRVPSSEVFNHLMVTGIAEFPALFHILFGIEEEHQTEELEFQKASTKKKSKKKFVRLQTRIVKHERWAKLQSCVKSYLKSTIFLLDQMTDQKIITFILRRVNQNLLVYFACIPYIANKVVRVLNRFWSSSEETNRILAFIALRDLTILTPYPFIDVVLKSSYLTFVKNAKFTNRTTLSTIQFMSNCVVELFGLDYKCSYQHAFSHIRVLAVKLRNAIISKTQEHYRMIHSWQFYHSLNLWTEVLCTYADQVDMQLLVYPLVQVISGAVQLLPVQRYYPYHFLCIRLLLRLGRATNLFIPTLPFLLRILESHEFRKKFKPSTQKPLDWTCTLKVPNGLLHTRVLFDGIAEQLFELLLEHFAVYSYSISFPELAVPSIVTLKKFVKQCKIPEYCKIFKQLAQQLENGSTFIRSHRLKVDFAPKDVEKADNFLQEKKEQGKHPLIKFYEQQKTYREKNAQIDTKEDVFEMEDSE